MPIRHTHSVHVCHEMFFKHTCVHNHTNQIKYIDYNKILNYDIKKVRGNMPQALLIMTVRHSV